MIQFFWYDVECLQSAIQMQHHTRSHTHACKRVNNLLITGCGCHFICRLYVSSIEQQILTCKKYSAPLIQQVIYFLEIASEPESLTLQFGSSICYTCLHIRQRLINLFCSIKYLNWWFMINFDKLYKRRIKVV